MEYLNMDLRIRKLRRRGVRVEVVHSPAGQAMAESRLPKSFESAEKVRLLNGVLLGLRAGELEVFRDMVSNVEGETIDAEQVGGILFQSLFAGAVRTVLDESRGAAQAKAGGALRLNLRFDLVDSTSSWLSGLPWELLFRSETRDFLGLSRSDSIVRYLEVQRGEPFIAPELPLRIGLVLAGPKNYPPLSLLREKSLIGSIWGGSPDVEVEILGQGGAGSLRAQLLDGGFHVLHFMGHGSFDERTGTGALVFEGSSGLAEIVPGSKVGNLVKGVASLRLVVLNACKSAVSSLGRDLDPFAGVASALVLAGVPAVVGMRSSISDKAAIAFSSAFYQRLSAADDLDAAVAEGRLAIYWKSSETLEWCTPLLFMRTPIGQFVSPGSRPSGGAEVSDGLSLLRDGRFEEASACLQQALRMDPRSPSLAAYFAISRLSNRPLFALPQELADDLNDLLSGVLEGVSGEEAYLATLVLGILRHDFYLPRDLRPRGVASIEIFRQLEKKIPDSKGVALLAGLRLSRAARILFNMDRVQRSL